jgi:hypothetical protein
MGNLGVLREAITVCPAFVLAIGDPMCRPGGGGYLQARHAPLGEQMASFVLCRNRT